MTKIKKESTNTKIYSNLLIDFETNSFVKKISDFIFIPILNSLPSGFQKFVKKSNSSAKGVIDNKTTHKALEILYHKGNSNRKKSFKENFFKKIWFNTNNSKGVRNRLKIVKCEITKAIQELSDNEKDINMLSIASGSARAVLEAVRDSNISEKCKVSITFLDKNPVALEYSKGLVRELNISKRYNLNWVNDTASGFVKYFKTTKPNIVEMVGLLDYFTIEKTEQLFKLIRENLDENGIFISANIAPNSEMKFITNLIGWKMNYKTPEDMVKIATNAQFEDKNIAVYYEPLKVHSVVITRK